MKNTVFNITRGVYGAMLGIIFAFLICLQSVKYACKIDFIFPNIGIFVCVIAVFLLMYFLFTELRKRNFLKFLSFDFDKAVKILTCILFIAQIYISFNIIFDTGWDSGAITGAARLLASGNSEGAFANYPFSIYPNNLFLLFVETFFIKLNDAFGVFLDRQSLMGIVIVNCIINSFACYLIYKSVSLYIEKSFALLGFLLGVALFGLSPWIVICYSDSFGLLFPVLSFWLFFKPSKSTVSKCINLSLAVFTGCLGYFIKPQCAIMLIALIIIGLIYNFRLKDKKVLLKSGVSAICLILSLLIIKTGISTTCKRFNYNPEPDKKFGMTHFLMMGLNPDRGGVYSDQDVAYSDSFTNPKERQKANIDCFTKRLKTMGPIGYAKYLTKKTLTVYNDGTFAWGVEGSFYVYVPENPNTKASRLLRGIYYTNEQGIYSKYFALFEQTVWITVILFAVLAVFTRSSDKNKMALAALMLTIIGLTVFEWLFEARARYLYTCAPIYCILAAFGIKNAFNFVNNGVAVFKSKLAEKGKFQTEQ